MTKLDPEVTAYIEQQPEAVARTLEQLRKMIRAAFPKAGESMYRLPSGQGFPVYKIGEEWVSGFAARSKGPMLYVMDQVVVERYKPQLGRLADGKSCVLCKPTKTLDEAQLLTIFQTMLAESAQRRS